RPAARPRAGAGPRAQSGDPRPGPAALQGQAARRRAGVVHPPWGDAQARPRRAVRTHDRRAGRGDVRADRGDLLPDRGPQDRAEGGRDARWEALRVYEVRGDPDRVRSAALPVLWRLIRRPLRDALNGGGFRVSPGATDGGRQERNREGGPKKLVLI